MYMVSTIILLAPHLLKRFQEKGGLVGSCSLFTTPCLSLMLLHPLNTCSSLGTERVISVAPPKSGGWGWLRMANLLRMTYMNTTVVQQYIGRGDLADSAQMWSWTLTHHMFFELQYAAASLLLTFHLLQVSLDLAIPGIIEVYTCPLFSMS